MKSFTLIETMVAVVVFALVMGATTGLILMAYRTQNYTWQQAVAIDEARKGIETMVKEIREAKPGEDGSYPIELANDKEFIFYSDIDNDGLTERVRYFLGTQSSGSQTQKCFSLAKGGTCSVIYTNFLKGTLTGAKVSVSVEGDLGASKESVDIFADGRKLGTLCGGGCSDCAGVWQSTNLFDVAAEASDNYIQFLAVANNNVDPSCNWEEYHHSVKAQFILSWTEQIPDAQNQFKKGVIKPVGSPVQYPRDQEKVSILSFYVRNSPPIFEYFDNQGNKIAQYPSRLVDTKLMKVFLVVNVNPNRPPQNFELESSVQLRNLKEE